MIQEIKGGIIQAIRKEFDKEYRIYKEKIEQDLKTPSFYVKCVTPVQRHRIRKRYIKSYTFNVTYFPESDNAPEEECMAVCEVLMRGLERITTSFGELRADGEMSGKMIDGCLQFGVTYSVNAMKTEPVGDSMETLKQNVSVE